MCQEVRTHLYTTFVDLTKAFDSLNCDGLWKIMQKFGCSESFTHIVRQLHGGMMARVTDNETVAEAFAVTNGVKQGCVFAPNLFNLMFYSMLTDTYHEESPGNHTVYRMYDQLRNKRQMRFHSHVSTGTLHKRLFADVCALNAMTEGDSEGAWTSSSPPAKNSDDTSTRENGSHASVATQYHL
ncbi:unnamed protein product [Schistocephalus solidus]|uniref:Reverse transcriptase domain-containing protein n=1 Tax=Schistocephalus solidus TaxID=70667 RepID=A0A183T3U0_SCHSO|nr:unnamed protein product [Schistocephalus solidus]